MGVFDKFSEEAQRFNWLLENYPEETTEVYRALVQCGAIDSVGYGRYDPTPDVPLRFKKILVAYESDIKKIHLFVEQDRRKQEVANQAARFPHAYVFFCKKEGIPENNITKLSPEPTMPGNWLFKTFAPHNHKTLFDHDDHFQQMVTEELARFGYAPYIPRPESTTPGTVTRTSTSSIYRDLNLKKYFSSKKDLSPNPFLTLGFSLKNASGRISIDPHKHTIEVKDFAKNKDIDAIYKHLSEFPAKEKSLSFLLEREKKWHVFEDKVLGHEFGCHYYRLYFLTQYGTDQVGLDKYEALGADPTVLNNVIQEGEKTIKDILKDNPYGFEEFKKTHPGIPRYEYYKHRAVIEKLERKSRYAKYDVNQTDLSSAVVSSLSANTSWTIEQQDIPCRLESYDGRMSRGHCKMVHLFKKMVYHDAMDDSAAPYLELFPHCTDIIRNSSIFNGDASETAFQEEVFESFTEILIPIIDSYLTVFRTNCITVVLSEMAWACICPKEHLNGSDLYASMESTKGLYRRIIKKKPSFSNLLRVIPSSLYDVEQYTPYIFVDLMTSSERVSRQFQVSADSFCLSSSVSFLKIIDEEEIKAIEAFRKKNEEDHQIKEIQDLKRSYPWGFQYFCGRYGIKESDYLLRYSWIMNARDEIRQAQRNEEDRQKEAARRQYETKIINQALRLIEDCPNAAKESGYLSTSSIDYSAAQQVLSKESTWRECEILYYKRFELFGVSRSVSGLPHKFFLDYYPSKRYDDNDLTKEQVSNRSFIWGFKDGKDYYQERAVEMVGDYLNGTRLKPHLNKIVFVCSPASTSISNSTRFQFFSKEVCDRTGMIDGFGHIHLTGFTTPKRMGGHGCVEFDADRSFFAGRFVILFDDIVTSGGTISTTKSRLEQVGARVIGVVSLGKTV